MLSLKRKRFVIEIIDKTKFCIFWSGSFRGASFSNVPVHIVSVVWASGRKREDEGTNRKAGCWVERCHEAHVRIRQSQSKVWSPNVYPIILFTFSFSLVLTVYIDMCCACDECIYTLFQILHVILERSRGLSQK